MNPLQDVDNMVLRLAKAAGDAGISIADISGYEAKTVDRSCRRLVSLGELHRGKIGHRTLRLFASMDQAAAYERNYRTDARLHAVAPRRARAQWAADAPIHYPKDEHGNPLYKHTVIPLPDRPANAPIRTNTHWQF